MRKGLILAALLPLLVSCSPITDLFSDRDVRVAVDPVVRQEIVAYAGGARLSHQPAEDPTLIPCNVASPRTCYTTEFINVSVENAGSSPIVYTWSCPPPFQRRSNGAWEAFATISVCSASLVSSEIRTGESATFPIALLSTASYDWLHSTDEFRVVLHLSDADGDIPARMRTSSAFRLRLR